MNNFRTQLYQLADLQMKEHAEARSYLEPFRGLHSAQVLGKLACTTLGVANLPCDQVLSTFFTPEAVDLLSRMPNRFWFWYTIKQACVADDGADNEVLGVSCVKRGVRFIRMQMGYKYSLRKAIADLADDGDAHRESQIASRAVVGLALIQNGPCELDRVVDNPLFFNPRFV